MSEALFTVIQPVAFGPEVSDAPRTAEQILAGHPSLRKLKPEQVAAQCVAAGQWKPYEGKNETLSTSMPVAPDRIAVLEERLARQEAELNDLRRMQKPATNRMKDAGENR